MKISLRKRSDKERLTLAMTEEGFEVLAMRMRRAMFMAGFCMGTGLVGLGFSPAYKLLGLLIPLAVAWIAWRGWPWDM